MSHGDFKLEVGPLDLREKYGVKSPMTLSKWRSQKTGLRVLHLDHEGPLVNGYFTVATEIFNDSGCPHTLEHLIFLGSEQYPYKGVLDSLANRAFAQGTNAWTDQTHTAYTIQTAGAEGFLSMLPVYLDHVLYPTLTDSGFVTEVYHQNGKGEDAGVVYSEMQARENGAGDLMQLKTQRTLFPEGSGYRSETGGLMEALRVLDVDTIRKYHSSYYLPHNLCLVVTGKIAPDSFLSVLQDKIEPIIAKHGQAHGPNGPEDWKRPFLETPSHSGPTKSTEDRQEIVSFPEEDESIGEVSMTWIGAKSSDFLNDKALDILTTYLTDSPISPFYKHLVEVEEPWCTDAAFYTSDFETGVITLYLSSVDSAKLESVREEVKSLLSKIVSEGIDMERMKMVVERDQRKLLNTIEKDASETFATSLISDFLYGSDDGKELVKAMDDKLRFDTLKGWTQEQWNDLLKKYFVDQSVLSVVGKPSSALAKQLEADTTKREEENRAKLGESGLAKLQEKLDAAQKENDKDIPPELLSQFPIPSMDSIRWFDVNTARAKSQTTKNWQASNKVQAYLDKEGLELPYFVQFDDVPSNFVEICITLSAQHVAPNLAKLLHLYISTFHSLPVKRSTGEVLPFEKVVSSLDTESVDYSIQFGPSLSECVDVSIKVTKDKYASAISWLRDLLYGSQFDIERLRITAKKLVQNLPSEKRDGHAVAMAIFRLLTQDEEKSKASALNLLRRLDDTPAIYERLQKEPEVVVKELEELRAALTTPSSMRISVSGDILSLPTPCQTFADNFAPSSPITLDPLLYGRDVLNTIGKSPTTKSTLAYTASMESSYGYIVSKGINRWDDPEIPKVMVARAVLNAMEGPLWKHIRGLGLAYGASLGADVERGFNYFSIYRSPDAAKALEKAKWVLESIVDGSMPIDELSLEAAKSSLAFSTANQVSSMGSAAEMSFINQALRDVPADHQRRLLVAAGDVTHEQVMEAIKTHLLPIFSPTSSIAAISSSKAKADDIASQLEKYGYEVEKRSLDKEGEEEESDESDAESEHLEAKL